MQAVDPDVCEFYDRLLQGCPTSHAQLSAMTGRVHQGAPRPGEAELLDQLRALHRDETVVVGFTPATALGADIDPNATARVLAALNKAGGGLMYPFGGYPVVGARGGGGRGGGEGGGFRGAPGGPRPGGAPIPPHPGPGPHPGPHPGHGGHGHPRRFFGDGGGAFWPYYGYGYGYPQACQQQVECPPNVVGPCYTQVPCPTYGWPYYGYGY